MTDAITREEKLMEAIATGSPSNIKPITREEMFLAKAGGQDVETPEPITRREKLLQGIIDNGVGGDSGGGGGSSGGTSATVPKNDVTFFDYDGTVLYSYTLAEAKKMTELPPLPSREGLVCQGWNYDLETIKSYDRPVDIGAAYITDDGKTRIYIHLEEGRTSPMLGVCPNGTVTVDWGDGTEPDVLTGTNITTTQWTPNHEYAKAGDYVIKLTVDGSMALMGSSSAGQYSGLLYCSSGSDARNYVYNGSVTAVEIGNGVTSIGNNAFRSCFSLKSVAIPDGITSIGNDAFSECSSLKSVAIPDGITSIGNDAFRSCYSLESVAIPDGITSIGYDAFRNCYSLESVFIPDGVTSIRDYTFYSRYSLVSVFIPDSVTSIGYNAFNGCYGVRYYDFTACTSVPTLSSANAFNGIAVDCEFRVPSSLYDKWINETNWATYAAKIVARG